MASSRRGLPEINAGSMADIAFLLLIFFLVTTTMDVDTGIARKLPAIPEEDQPEPPKIHAKNIYEVFVNANNQLLVEGEYIDISQLREGAKAFIDNNGRDANSSENPDKAIISLKCHAITEYKTYIQVQNELTAAYNELRDEAALKKFDERYADLNKTKKKEMKKMYPQKISEAEPSKEGKNL
jgi:biopolymer transport protein ExbD